MVFDEEKHTIIASITEQTLLIEMSTIDVYVTFPTIHQDEYRWGGIMEINVKTENGVYILNASHSMPC